MVLDEASAEIQQAPVPREVEGQLPRLRLLPPPRVPTRRPHTAWRIGSPAGEDEETRIYRESVIRALFTWAFSRTFSHPSPAKRATHSTCVRYALSPGCFGAPEPFKRHLGTCVIPFQGGFMGML